MKSPLLLILLLVLLAPAALRAEDTPPAQRPQFIYVLWLVERLHQDSGWTKADEEIVGRHFRHLKTATGKARPSSSDAPWSQATRPSAW